MFERLLKEEQALRERVRNFRAGDRIPRDALHMRDPSAPDHTQSDPGKRGPQLLEAGAEIALADTLVLIMKVMAMHGIIGGQAIDAVFSDLEQRYRGQQLNSAAAIVEYLRHHLADEDSEPAVRELRLLAERSTEGSA